MPHDQAPEHEYEARPGLPEPLPPGERLLWQGSPNWRVMAREVMHLRWLCAYFAVLLCWRAVAVAGSGGTLLDVVQALAWLTPLALLALGVLGVTAWLVSRTAVYTITDRRVVMRIGVVLSVTYNLPYSKIESAGLRLNADGSGDLTLVLDHADHIAYAHLWPHVRPWHLRHTEPMLRALPQARQVAALLATSLADSAGMARAALAVPATARPAPAAPSPQNPATQNQHPLAA